MDAASTSTWAENLASRRLRPAVEALFRLDRFLLIGARPHSLPLKQRAAAYLQATPDKLVVFIWSGHPVYL
jgi:hypothetical protein